MVNIKKAILADASTLSALCFEVQKYHADAYPEFFHQPEDEAFAVQFMAEMLAKPDSHLYLAESDGESVGYFFAQHVTSDGSVFTKPASRLHLHQISVKATHRRQGYGQRLLQALLALAEELEVESVTLNSWVTNETAVSFFQKAGFEPQHLTMRKSMKRTANLD